MEQVLGKTARIKNLIKRWLSKVSGGVKWLNDQSQSLLKKKWARQVISAGWILLFLIIVLALWKYRDQVIPYLVNANYFNLLIASAFFIFAVSATCVGWITIINIYTQNLGLWTHIYIYFATLAARRVPGTVWYIGGRMALYKQLGISQVSTSIASTLEIIVGIVSGCIISLVIFPFTLKLPAWLVVLSICCAITGLSILHPRLLSKLLTRLKRPSVNEISIKNTVTWLLTYASSWILGGIMLFFLINTFKPLPYQSVFFTIGAWATAGYAGLFTVFLPSSFGVTDITLTALISNLVPLPMAVVIAVINRFLMSIIEVLISFCVYIFSKKE